MVLPFIISQVVLTLILALGFCCEATVIINEVAYKGSPNQCDGKDWIELLNGNSSEMDLTNFTLHDDKGKEDEDAKIFANTTILPGEFMVLCQKIDFNFGIGGSDTVTLLDDGGSVVSEVVLQGTGGDDATYAYFSSGNAYNYTVTPTPGAINVYTAPKSFQEKLQEQNDEGKDFFLVNNSDFFSKVVDIKIVLDTEGLAIIDDHPTWETFVSFTSVSVSNSNETSKVIQNGGKGKIRTKGQSSLFLPACAKLKNIPFQIEFDSPFFGIEIAYFRNHFSDQSYMREYGSHAMLSKVGLPYLRTRPVRLYLNGDYRGFYIMMEAPTQAYVMQRSFGAFNPAITALFKVKTGASDCPYEDISQEDMDKLKEEEVPEKYYFERGDHRDAPPNESYKCVDWFYEQIYKEQKDVVKGFLKYNKTCGLTMVELGRVDRDYGAKSIENTMISFLDSKMYNTSVTDLKDFVDADQWIKNFAAYAVMLNFDSPINNINNWYIGTTFSGANDWRIVQYDHNNVASRDGADLCASQCGFRQIYWPILRPTCSAVEAHPIVGRILNDETSKQKYLAYIEEFIEVVDTGFFDDLRAYGNGIKEFIMDDPLNNLKVNDYETSELDSTLDYINSKSMPFLKVMEARIIQVNAQLEAIKEDNLPRDGIYGENEICPDWRDNNGDNYIEGETFVNSDSCSSDECSKYALCYSNSLKTCSMEGKLVIDECKPVSPFCSNCFPHSRCGSYEDAKSGVLVESDLCGSADKLAENCKLASVCFDHLFGMCAFDGKILTEECKDAEIYCKSCFPNSRCGKNSSDSPSDSNDSPSELLSKAPSKAPSKSPKVAPKRPIPVSDSKRMVPYIFAVFGTILVWCFVV